MTTKKSEPTNSSAAALEAILDKLGAMESKIETMENRIDAASKPPALTEVKSTDNADPYGEANSIIQSRYTDARSLLNKGDTVRLNEETEKGQTMLKNIPEDRKKVVAEQGILGTVEGYLHTSERTGEPKFHVKFVGFGTDGVLYRDLEIVSRR